MRFADLKHRVHEPEFKRIFALSADKPEQSKEIITEIQKNGELWGIVDDLEQIIGVVAFCVKDDIITIKNIATDEKRQKQGIGRAMISGVIGKYSLSLPVQAEADDRAVDFYRKCEFTATESDKKQGARRWVCKFGF